MLNDRLHPSDFRSRVFWVRRPPMPPNAPPMAAPAGRRTCIQGLSFAPSMASPASNGRSSPSFALSSLLESFSSNLIVPPIGLMCLIEVQKYGITRRCKSALALKKKRAIKHCAFFVLRYKTETSSCNYRKSIL